MGISILSGWVAFAAVAYDATDRLELKNEVIARLLLKHDEHQRVIKDLNKQVVDNAGEYLHHLTTANVKIAKQRATGDVAVKVDDHPNFTLFKGICLPETKL